MLIPPAVRLGLKHKVYHIFWFNWHNPVLVVLVVVVVTTICKRKVICVVVVVL
jgi:hypothetical protein